MYTRASVLVVAAVVLLSASTGVVAEPATAGAISADTAGGSKLAVSDAAPRVADADVAADVPVDADDVLASGASFWRGARLGFDAAELLGDGGGEIELWRVTEDGQLNQQVRTVAVDETGTHALQTGSLDGRYVLRYEGRPVAVEDGVARSSGVTSVAAAAFRIERQTLAFEWRDPTVYPGQLTTLTVESNRPSSVVAVTSYNRSFADLTAIFPESAYAENYDARANDSVLLLSIDGTTAFQLRTETLAPGSRSFVFDVVDSDARATADLTVLEPAPDRRFRSIERHEQVGDVVEAELACTHCFLIVGGPGQGLLDVVEISDANGDGNVSLRINTRYVGMFQSASGYPSGVEAYTSPEDDVERYSPSADLEAVQEALNYDVTTLNDLREQQGLEPSGRFRPVEPGQLRLTVSSSDYLIKRSAYGSGPPLGPGLVARDETDVETVTLSPASLDGVTALGAPGGGGFDATPATLAAVAGPRDHVALGDRLVFRIDVSGVFGYLEAEGSTADGVDLDALLHNREEGIDLELERVDGGTAESLRIDRVASELVADPESDSLYLVLRTGGTSSNYLGDGQYRATFTVDGVAAEFGAYSTRNAYAGYPYVEPGASDSVSGSATLAEPIASITDPEPGTDAHVTEAGALRVNGTASVAAGTTLTVEAASTEFAWETRKTTTARADGTWTSALDLSRAPGDEFDVAVYGGNQRLAGGTYTVLPPAEEGDGGDGSGSNGGDGGPAGSSNPQEAGSSIAGIPLPDLGGLGDLAVPIGASVGGLAVVWGAWRLVIRRLLQ